MIVRARFDQDGIDYLAFSPLFDPIESGTEAPIYDLVVEQRGATEHRAGYEDCARARSSQVLNQSLSCQGCQAADLKVSGFRFVVSGLCLGRCAIGEITFWSD